MSKYDIKYKTGDEIFVAGKIQKVEIINGEIYYKIAEAEELIPQGKVFPKMVRALVNIARGNYSELDFDRGQNSGYCKTHLLAGKGSSKEIRIIDQLTPIGGRASDWKHEKAYYRVVDPDGSPAFVEMHWFQCEGVPGRYREYIKEREGEAYFYDIDEWENRWKW